MPLLALQLDEPPARCDEGRVVHVANHAGFSCSLADGNVSGPNLRRVETPPIGVLIAFGAGLLSFPVAIVDGRIPGGRALLIPCGRWRAFGERVGSG